MTPSESRTVLDAGRSTSQRTPAYILFVLAAVALAPLQEAFTLDVGAPLKPTEVLVGLAAIAFVFARRRGRSPREFLTLLVLLIFVGASAGYHLLVGSPSGPFYGYVRSPNADLLLYTAYPVFVVIMWRILVDVPPEKFRSALRIAIWVCFLGVVLQIALSELGRVDLLESMGYETKIRSESLDGSGEGTMRNGTFTEGQHLGFFAGFSVFVALRMRAYLSAVAAALSLVYSQSTTGVVGVVLVIAVLVFLRPSLNGVLRFLAIVVALLASLNFIPVLQNLFALQFAKLGLSGFAGHVDDATTSLEVRTLKSDIATRMMFENPLLGVGPGRFGIFYFEDPQSSQSPEWYFSGNNRAIAENVYLHIGSEFGVIALVIFVIFLFQIFRRVRRAGFMDLGAYLFILIAILTQSSWTFIPVWIALAYVFVASPLNPVPNQIRARRLPAELGRSRT